MDHMMLVPTEFQSVPGVLHFKELAHCSTSHWTATAASAIVSHSLSPLTRGQRWTE